MIAGVDEVGRGCLAGPVCACAVIIRERIPFLQDSKKLSPKKRLELSRQILNSAWVGYGEVDAKTIDQINIHQASLLAMQRAIENLSVPPKEVLVDGKFGLSIAIPNKAIIGGDNLVDEISAASIVAKVWRDSLMADMELQYPEYGFAKHKGYPTKLHKEALRKHGPSSIHRVTFAGVLSEK